MQRAEMRDTGALLATTLDEFTTAARDVHQAVAGRVFGLLGSVGRPVKLLHDAISATAYTSTRLGVKVVPSAVGLIAAETTKPSAESIYDTDRGRLTLSALNGILGDRIAAERTSLAPVMSARTHLGRLRSRPGNIVHDLDDEPSGRLVVFAHGLCCTDRYWWLGAEKSWGDPDVTYGSLLHEERGWTPLYLHYNTGLHISENGRRLAEYLETLVDRWPVPVTEIALVGHSMGGLISRSASHAAVEHDLTWVKALRHVVGLGAPHLGAPLERFVNQGTHAMAKVPETRPLAALLNQRSVGIKDLRYGSIVEADWAGIDPDERLDRCTPADLLPGVAYSMVSATLSREPTGPFAHDLLVEHISAHGTGRPDATRRIEFEIDRLLHVGRSTHMHLLNNPVVYRQLRAWLEGADGAAAATAHITETTAD